MDDPADEGISLEPDTEIVELESVLKVGIPDVTPLLILRVDVTEPENTTEEGAPVDVETDVDKLGSIIGDVMLEDAKLDEPRLGKIELEAIGLDVTEPDNALKEVTELDDKVEAADTDSIDDDWESDCTILDRVKLDETELKDPILVEVDVSKTEDIRVSKLLIRTEVTGMSDDVGVGVEVPINVEDTIGTNIVELFVTIIVEELASVVIGDMI